MTHRFRAAAVFLVLASAACGQAEEPEPDPTINIDVPQMTNPAPVAAPPPAAGVEAGAPGIVGDDTIAGPYTPDTVGAPTTP